ncbi:adenylyl-sulfate kinase [Allosaccharopolyspora coralli]|uniref:adenylyl-sulfate kinase n=1 Tax=Allosaccharopolyspora coralli TaxID=2665642 RepID=UPI001E49AEA8|nr:adenylyl-sulfate kinase [Allosaccharopolyspora coralli]
MSAETTTTSATEVRPPIRVLDRGELADLELLLDGAFGPLNGYLGAEDAAAVRRSGRLLDGSPWPVPVTLSVPAEDAAHASLELHDAEGAPVGVVENRAPWSAWGRTYVAGPVRPAGPDRGGTLRALRPSAAASRRRLTGRPVLGLVVRSPLHSRRIAEIRHVAESLGAAVLVLPRMLGPRAETLVEAVLAAEPELPSETVVVPVPLRENSSHACDETLCAHVAAAYGATHVLSGGELEQSPIPVVHPPELARDARNRWLPAETVPPEQRRGDLTDRELTDLLDTGASLPSWFTTPAVAEQQARLHPPLRNQGFTLLFTGLSGAGKSTLARGVRDELARHDRRAVSLLDGDVVRRFLCEGLGFSAEDRSRNVRRIGWVAAEVARHGGAAICAPIAPYAADRQAVREMVEVYGGFVLVHVATPLQECERRDRKGLYLRARCGDLREFTGVTAPYESPQDADLVLDTSETTSGQAVDRVLDLLRERGWIDAWGDRR